MEVFLLALATLILIGFIASKIARISGEAFERDVRRDERERCIRRCEQVEDGAYEAWREKADPLDQGRAVGAADCVASILTLKEMP